MPKTVETHPLKPFFPKGARLLMLGSFPPKREKWAFEFYYPNFQNDMWRIFGVAFFGDKDCFLNPDKKSFSKPRIEKFLKEKGIALSDTAESVIRHKDNASDKFLEIVKPLDLKVALKKLPQCEAVCVTGQKAAEMLAELADAEIPKVGSRTQFEFIGRKILFYRMPSSSRAYPLSLAKKAEAYKHMFEELNMV